MNRIQYQCYFWYLEVKISCKIFELQEEEEQTKTDLQINAELVNFFSTLKDDIHFLHNEIYK